MFFGTKATVPCLGELCYSRHPSCPPFFLMTVALGSYDLFIEDLVLLVPFSLYSASSRHLIYPFLVLLDSASRQRFSVFCPSSHLQETLGSFSSILPVSLTGVESGLISAIFVFCRRAGTRLRGSDQRKDYPREGPFHTPFNYIYYLFFALFLLIQIGSGILSS